MRIGAASDTGQLRTTNEDLFWYDQRLLVIADGMGGHAAGEVAAQVAVETVSRWLYPDGDGTDESMQEAVRQAVEAANEQVYDRARRDRALEGMGTTLTMMLLGQGQGVIGHVGDSRAYLLRDGRLRQLTADHSVTAELVRSGGLTEREASRHPYRNFLTRALGAEQDVLVDVLTVDLLSGDGILLCTDGLTAVLPDEAIVRVLHRFEDPQQAADELVRQANEGGGPDNITVVFARYEVPIP